MIVAYSAHRPDSVTATLAIHLIAYCAIGACLASSLYTLLQPSRVSTSSVTDYKLVPAMVVRDDEPLLTRGAASPIAPVAPNMPVAPIATIAPMEPEAETTGLSNPQPEIKPTVTAPSQPQTNKRPNRVVKPNREVKMESPKPRTAPCIPAYDSSGAQTRPCG